MRDIMCSGYVAGGNTGFFGERGQGGITSPLTGPVNSNDVKYDINSRLSMDDEERGEYQSMLAFGCGYGDGAKRDQVISITDRLLPWEVNGSEAGKAYFPGGNANYLAYKQAWDLHTIHFGEDMRASENMEFISQGSANNGLCFVGPHRKYNPYSNLYHELIPGQGHCAPHTLKHSNTLALLLCHRDSCALCTSLTLICSRRICAVGPDAIPGDARWRRGEAVSLKAARDSMVSLEVAAHAQMYLGKK